jgi:hypothetical protein
VLKAENFIAMVSRLSRKCAILDISELYRPARPLTAVALLTVSGYFLASYGYHLMQLWAFQFFHILQDFASKMLRMFIVYQ